MQLQVTINTSHKYFLGVDLASASPCPTIPLAQQKVKSNKQHSTSALSFLGNVSGNLHILWLSIVPFVCVCEIPGQNIYHAPT